MGLVISSASVSLDGFIALPDNSVGALFDWYDSGDIEVPNAGELPPFHLTADSAAYWNSFRSGLGALLVGRTLFDYTNGWNGTHPLDVPVVVLTHAPPTDWNPPGAENFRFVSTGIADAVATAQDIAGDRTVGAAAGTVAGQLLQAGLLDRVAMDLVPVVLGAGRRYFGDADVGDHFLSDPSTVVPGVRVTHLLFDVQR